MTATALTAEKPFDFASTPGKLPKNVVPEEYAIRITPNVEKRTFTGSETIRINARESAKEVVLNSAEIKIGKAAIDGKSLPAGAIKTDENNETLTLVAELAPGNHQIELEFAGKINQRGVGLYYAPYQEQGTGAKKVMLGTQFEATDARRMFPCWDEPSFRARFQLTAVIPETSRPFQTCRLRKRQRSPAEKRFGLEPLHPWRATSTSFARASSTRSRSKKAR